MSDTTNTQKNPNPDPQPGLGEPALPLGPTKKADVDAAKQAAADAKLEGQKAWADLVALADKKMTVLGYEHREYQQVKWIREFCSDHAKRVGSPE